MGVWGNTKPGVTLEDPTAIPAGRVPGVRLLHKYGYNGAVGASYEDIWSGGGSYSFLTSASALRVAAGGDANDTAAGTGAQQVTVYGLDATGVEVEEAIETAGALASSATTQTFIRVNRVIVTRVGTYGGSNVGAITIETTGSTTQGHVPAGFSQSQQCIYTVPLNHSLMLTESVITTDGNGVNVRLYVREGILNTASNIMPVRVLLNWANITIADDSAASNIVLPQLTDVWLAAIRTTGTDSFTTGHFDGYIWRSS